MECDEGRWSVVCFQDERSGRCGKSLYEGINVAEVPLLSLFLSLDGFKHH